MRTSLALFVSLTCWCAVLLACCGDFTPYVGEPDRDVYVTMPSAAQQLSRALTAGAVFAIVTVAGFALLRRLLPGHGVLRLFLVTVVGFTTVLYVYGDFKTYFGVGREREVFYELPWGTTRFLISGACGLVLSGLTAGMAASARYFMQDPGQTV
jgi:hypothetical protein